MSGNKSFSIETVADRFYAPQSFREYRATPDDLLPILYQAGYLTIKEAKLHRSDWLYRLGFPNEEVQQGFTDVMLSGFLVQNQWRDSWITDVQDALTVGDTERLRLLFGSFFASIPLFSAPSP